MKRSDMVINIAISLMSRLPEWEKQERLKFADEILSNIEIEGMLPPNVRVTQGIFGNNKGDIEKLEDVTSYEYEICWEPEDE
jgi:hypothetical protein